MSNILFPKRHPISLNVQCQIQVLKLFHPLAARLESEYIEDWLGTQLSQTSRQLEQTIDIRKADIDTEEVVDKYQSQQLEELKRKRELLEEKMQIKKRPTRGKIMKRKKPYHSTSTKELQPKVIEGIPEGVDPRSYIEYRKCKYIVDIGRFRAFLQHCFCPAILNDLMLTMYNIAQYNNKHEHGLLTLQAMLSNEFITDFRIAPATFYKNFLRGIDGSGTNSNLETTIGTTILHYMLIVTTRITHLSLERCGCDSLLKLLSEKAENLKYLNISGSVVSDQGLFHLCGIEKLPNRERPMLSRACKAKSDSDRDRLVKNELPRWLKRKPGCKNLAHIEAKNLQRIDWPGHNQVYKYYDFSTVPLDSGFVALLMFLPKLIILETEVGGRAVQAYAKVYAKQKRSPPPLRLRLLCESHLTPPLLEEIGPLLPEVQRLTVDWYEFFTVQLHHREDWLDRIDTLPKLTELTTRDIDYKLTKLKLALPLFGSQLTKLDLRELWKFQYSNFRAIKQFCPNLVYLALLMTTKDVVATIARIQVDKDLNLQLHNDTYHLSKLKTFHISGPFNPDVIKYFVKGCDEIINLSLGIQWLDPTFCDVQPLQRKDILGREFFEEVLTVNPLEKLEELHLTTLFRRGRTFLKRPFAEFILERFPRLRHFGNFQLWHMSRMEVDSLIAECRSRNRGITFDEDLYTQSHDLAMFEYKYIPNRQLYACSNQIELRKESPGFITDFFEVLTAPPELFESDEDSDDDGDMMGGDVLDMDSDLEDNIEEDLEPVCVIM